MRLNSLLLPSLVLALTAAGCSFPTDDFRVGGDAAADTRRPDADVPPPDTVTPPPDAVTPDDVAPDQVTPPPDVDPDAVVPPPDMVTPPPDAGCSTNAECTGGRVCCEGTCVDAQTSNAHCGRCGAVCDPPNGAPSCAAGVCGVMACDMGFGNCDMNAANGCESTLASDPMNCGGCATRCTAPQNAAAACNAGRCGFACNPGFADCNLNAADGCEEDLRVSTRACGACGTACAGPAGTTSTCVAGECETQCAPGSADCDMNPANGCEVNTGTSLAHCGGCGLQCVVPNGTAVCVSAICQRASCNAGFGDCDGNIANGCETVTSTSNAHCGGCGRACPAGQACRAGACSATCAPAPLMMCGAACVDTSTSAANCGSCGRVCTYPNAAADCRASNCVQGACVAGFADCAAGTPGCETNVNTDVNNCGGCGVTCGRTNGTPTCTAGACGVVCNAGFTNCDGDPSDGCETATGTDVRNCGMCGRTCSFPNAGATCVGGTCALGTCQRETGNCDGNAANGCEAALASDESNCGACGAACLRGQLCASGRCIPCSFPGVVCGTRCVNTQSSATNCGACDRACLAGQVCTLGRCGYPTPANDACSGATDINLASGPRVTVSATTLGAGHSFNSPCDAAGGGDVFFRFVLTRREFVYADTFGATWDTKLFFMNSCTTALPAQTTSDLVCDDNLGASCATGGTASQVYTVLNPGTYYLVLSSGTSAGATSIRFEHLPVGSGALSFLSRGTSALRSGATSGTTGGVSQSCGGAGPEVGYWWVTCPEQTAGTLNATTCLRASWNTVLAVTNGSGVGNVCVNDTCGLQSTVSTTIPAGSGLHLLSLDGFNNGTDPQSGSYSIVYTRP